ncbi:hypothetical protein [Neptuniibacter halophilus]|uniref:hypothetical protein n=1 Tax=Neptuniibacter halophilus TaxID=651666 RepID=UPI002572FF4B|nr:hypothetical protein [Neptuniibacter halophilus]
MQKKLIKTLSTLLVLILIPVVLAAGAYGFIWWKVSSAADEFAREIAPFATMQYQQVHIDLLGSEVGLKQMSFTPAGNSNSIQMQSATLKAPSWGFLLDLSEKLNQGEIPESLDLKLTGIVLDLNSDYVRDWNRMAEDMQGGMEITGQSYETLGCGDLSYVGVNELRKMGYGSLSSDLSLQYGFDAVDRQIFLDVNSKTERMADMQASVTLQVATSELDMQSLMFAQPQLNRFEVEFKDRGYNKRRNRFCAKLNKEEEPAYRERYRSLLAQRLASEGWIIPEPVMASIDTLNNPGGSFSMRVDIPQGFGVQSMALIQTPSDLLDALNPYVELSGKPVSLDGVSWQLPDPTLVEQPAVSDTEVAIAGDQTDDLVQPEEVVEDASDMAPEADAEPKTPVVSSFDRTPQRKSFKPISVSSLSAHLGETVALYTYFGRKVEGKLISATSKEVTIEHRLVDGRGTATYPIAMEKIETAKLYH